AFSTILALPNICMVFGAPFLGRASDHVGRKLVLLVGLTGVAFSFLLSTFAIFWGSLFLLFISRALAGFMDGSEAIAQAAIADLSVGKEKARHMAFATFAGTIGFIIGPVLGGFLAEPSFTGRFHYEIPYMISFLLTLVNGITLYLYFPKQPPTHEYPKKIGYLAILSKGFSIAFDRRIRVYSWLIFVLQWALATFYQISTLFLVDRFRYSSGDLGLFTTFVGMSFSGGIFFVIHALLNRFQHVNILKAGIGFIILSLLIALSLNTSELFPWISVIPLMLGIAMMYNVLLAFISNAVTNREQGDAMGSSTSLKAIGWLSSSLIVGWLYPHLLALLGLMLIVSLLGLISSTLIKTKD